MNWLELWLGLGVGGVTILLAWLIAWLMTRNV